MRGETERMSGRRPKTVKGFSLSLSLSLNAVVSERKREGLERERTAKEPRSRLEEMNGRTRTVTVGMCAGWVAARRWVVVDDGSLPGRQ